MDVRILGPLEVEHAGRVVELGGSRPRALVAILALRRGEVVSADRLIDDLYGGRPPATAAKSVQVHVSRIRRALAPEQRLQTRAGGYALELEPDELDAERCRRLLAEGRRALAAGEAEAAASALDAAVALWRGPPLADFTYDAFARDEIVRLEELRLECLEERVEAQLALGHEAAVLPELEQLVALQPLRERPRAQLMLALYRCGRQAEALAAYQDVRHALVEELGIDPGRRLQELERAILNQDPRLDPPARPAPAPRRGDGAGRLAAGPFAGRRRELALLESSVADARAGRGRLALVTGPPGSGKTRLADELASRAKRSGLRILWGAAWAAGGAPACWPWTQALRAYVRSAEAEALREQAGGGAVYVARIVPELRDALPDAAADPPAAAGEEDERFRLFDAASAFIRRTAAEQPLVIVLDDLHAADLETVRLLDFAAVELADAPVLLLATAREPEGDDAVAAAIRELGRRASVRIALRPPARRG